MMLKPDTAGGPLHADTWMLMRLWCWEPRCMLPI